MTKRMLRVIIFLLAWCGQIVGAEALEVKHKIKSSVGFFDAAEETLSYAFFKDKDYDVKTTVETTGVFGTLYPFQAMYHSIGSYDKKQFYPQDYFYEAKSRFKHRTKEIFYQDGIPQYRVSVKNEKKRRDVITIDEKYPYSGDLLSVFGELIYKIIKTGKCDFEQYSFNGKKYAKSKVTYLGKEKIKTDYFEGKAIKCQFKQEILEDTDAGFLLNKDVPIYFWVLRDKETKAYFLARALIESTPFGKLEAITTSIEVKE